MAYRNLDKVELSADNQNKLATSLRALQKANNYTATQISKATGIDAKRCRRLLKGLQPLTWTDLGHFGRMGQEWQAVETSVKKGEVPVVEKTRRNPRECPKCGATETRVQRSEDPTVKSAGVSGPVYKDVILVRLRMCRNCRHKSKTYEIPGELVEAVYRNQNSGSAQAPQERPALTKPTPTKPKKKEPEVYQSVSDWLAKEPTECAKTKPGKGEPKVDPLVRDWNGTALFLRGPDPKPQAPAAQKTGLNAKLKKLKYLLDNETITDAVYERFADPIIEKVMEKL
jgi:predicted RNA-binding Zn-ribbon protein involved in translation (DUF1610 family)